jgi:predicted secreted hydrolase
MRRRDFLLALAALSGERLAAAEPFSAATAAGSPPATVTASPPAATAAAASGPVAGLGADSAPDAAVVYPPVVRGRTLRFPADHGAHPDFRTEWWYATGWLASAGGEPFGFQTTFFRLRTGIGERNPSAFAPRQLVLAHAAVSDPAHGRLRHAERAARAGFGRAGFAHGKTAVWIGDWRFEQEVQPNSDSDVYRAEVRGDDFAYSLRLAAAGPALLNGDAGFSAKAADPRHASYYYSRPQLAVSGTLTRAGRRQEVSGRAWLDHEWSSELLPQAAQGWDWVGINLADGGALMAFRLRRPDGSPLWAAATLQAADGKAQA